MYMIMLAAIYGHE